MDLPTENVQSYPRPPRLEPVPHRIRVRFADRMIVDTQNAFRVLETHHPPTYYIPPDDCDCELRAIAGHTYCEWKGAASYYDVLAGGRTARRAAWCYTRPTSSFRDIKGYLAFYAALMEACDVGGVSVLPQAGQFYGGWLTPNLTGMAKGAPGTEHW